MPIGEAIIYMSMMVMQILVGLVVATYASHCFLVVVELTAAGNDEVRWPSDPMKDWLWKPFYLAWLLGPWIVFAGIGASWVANRVEIPKGHVFVALIVPGLWLFFPISLMSSLSANSRWIIFRFSILKGLLRIPIALLGFYASTAVLLSLAAGSILLAGRWRSYLLMPIPAAIVGASFLIYARLMGRLAWKLTRLTIKTTKPVPKAHLPSGPPKKRKRPVRPAKANDPWKVPQPGPDAPVGPVVSPWYAVAAARRLAASASAHWTRSFRSW